MKNYNLIGKAAAGALAALLLLVFTAGDALAVPSFARRENMKCSACHTAWPMLNAFGRIYKENGYQVMRGQPAGHTKISDKLTLARELPLSLIINSRPVDKKKNGDTKLRAIHEAELLAVGNFAGWGSLFLEIKAEDEGNFNAELDHAIGGIHINPYVNVLFGKGSIFSADPYNTLNNRRLTVAHSRLTTEVGDSGGSLGENTQNIQFYGRAKKVFYQAAIGADNGDSEGIGPPDYALRLAVDVLPKQLSVGGFYLDGTQDVGSGEADFKRWGFDFQGRVGPVNYQGSYTRLEDDNVSNFSTGTVSGNQKNDLFLAELFYTAKCEALMNLPIPITQVVPFARVEYFERADGSDERTDMILNLTTYFTENFRASVEYFQTLDGPDDRRWTGSLVFGF